MNLPPRRGDGPRRAAPLRLRRLRHITRVDAWRPGARLEPIARFRFASRRPLVQVPGMFPFLSPQKTRIPEPGEALPGRAEPMAVPARHYVLDAPLDAAFEGMERAMFGMGCFWGAEKRFWTAPGVVSTAVGYAAGHTPNPTYEEVCSGRTGHNEVVRVVYDPQKTSFAAMLERFWEGHNPTQGMRQGNDVGTQYRSGIYAYDDAQRDLAERSMELFQARLREAGFGDITTEVRPSPTFYFAEGYHQQYLAKNPGGYCGLGGTGVSCPVGALAG